MLRINGFGGFSLRASPNPVLGESSVVDTSRRADGGHSYHPFSEVTSLADQGLGLLLKFRRSLVKVPLQIVVARQRKAGHFHLSGPCLVWQAHACCMRDALNISDG